MKSDVLSSFDFPFNHGNADPGVTSDDYIGMDVSHSVWCHMDVQLESVILYKQKFVNLRQTFTSLQLGFLRSEEMLFLKYCCQENYS